jgi:dihydroorotase
MLDLVVEGNAYLDGQLKKCCIGINNGKIIKIKKILKGDKQFDFGDKLIMPAGIDIHVHFRDPGFNYKEDFRTGTEAAAFGGMSCILDMPNTKPPVISIKTLQDKLKLVSKKANIDFGLYSSITSKMRIPKIAELCTGFKLYLASTTGDLLFSNDWLLASVLERTNLNNRIPVIHAESERIIRDNEATLGPAKNLHEHLLIRSNKAEAESISNLIEIAKTWSKNSYNKALKYNEKTKLTNLELNEWKDFNEIEKLKELRKEDNSHLNRIIAHSNKHIHICHLSTSQGVELLRNYRNSIKQYISDQAIIMTTEVTPHHILLNEKFNNHTMGKVNPPLRTTDDQSALWSALADGTINVLASDHAPHTLDDKTQDFAEAPAGLPGVETMLPLFISFVKHNKLNLDTFISAISTTPAALFNLPKGRLAEGYDGDLIVIDFYKESKIKVRNLHSKCGWSPYENMEAIFPVFTVVRGNITIKDNNLEVDPGTGKFYN